MRPNIPTAARSFHFNTPLERDALLHAQLPHTFPMLIAEEAFGEAICCLQSCGDVHEGDSTISDVLADEVVPHRDVFGKVMVTGVLGQLDGPLIIHPKDSRTRRFAPNPSQ